MTTNSNEQTVALTGAAGYIGRNLLDRLASDNRIKKIITLDRIPLSGHVDCDHHKLDLAIDDVDLRVALDGVDTIFHLAAARTDWGLTHDEYHRDNVLATRNLIAAARIAGVRRWVYYGTVGVYGSSAVPLSENAPFRPSSNYAATKATAEEELLKVATKEEWALRIIRPSAVFSEQQPDNTNLYRLIEAIRRNKFLLIGKGSSIKTTSYLHNLIDATLWLYDGLDKGGVEAFNYVDSPKLTTRQMIELIRSELGCRFPLVQLPLNVVERPARLFDWIGNYIGRDLPITSARIRKFCTATNFDSSKLRQAGFVPKYSSHDAILRTVHWHRELSRAPKKR